MTLTEYIKQARDKCFLIKKRWLQKDCSMKGGMSLDEIINNCDSDIDTLILINNKYQMIIEMQNESIEHLLKECLFVTENVKVVEKNAKQIEELLNGDN